MLKVWLAPKNIKVPQIKFKKGQFDRDGYKKAEKVYYKAVEDYCKREGSGKYKGKIVRFPVADSYAEYMVLSTRPCELVHLEIGDAWEYRYIDKLSAKDIIKEIESEEEMQKLFKR